MERSFPIVNKLGLHARAAALLVKEANRFSAEIWLSRDGQTVNAKSIMGVLLLAAGHGSTVRVRAEGDDAEQALDALEALFASGFGEGRVKVEPP